MGCTASLPLTSSTPTSPVTPGTRRKSSLRCDEGAAKLLPLFRAPIFSDYLEKIKQQPYTFYQFDLQGLIPYPFPNDPDKLIQMSKWNDDVDEDEDYDVGLETNSESPPTAILLNRRISRFSSSYSSNSGSFCRVKIDMETLGVAQNAVLTIFEASEEEIASWCEPESLKRILSGRAGWSRCIRAFGACETPDYVESYVIDPSEADVMHNYYIIQLMAVHPMLHVFSDEDDEEMNRKYIKKNNNNNNNNGETTPLSPTSPTSPRSGRSKAEPALPGNRWAWGTSGIWNVEMRKGKVVNIEPPSKVMGGKYVRRVRVAPLQRSALSWRDQRLRILYLTLQSLLKGVPPKTLLPGVSAICTPAYWREMSKEWGSFVGFGMEVDWCGEEVTACAMFVNPIHLGKANACKLQVNFTRGGGLISRMITVASVPRPLPSNFDYPALCMVVTQGKRVECRLGCRVSKGEAALVAFQQPLLTGLEDDVSVCFEINKANLQLDGPTPPSSPSAGFLHRHRYLVSDGKSLIIPKKGYSFVGKLEETSAAPQTGLVYCDNENGGEDLIVEMVCRWNFVCRSLVSLDRVTRGELKGSDVIKPLMLSDEARLKLTEPTIQLDFDNELFDHWVSSHQLNRNPEERILTFAERVRIFWAENLIIEAQRPSLNAISSIASLEPPLRLNPVSAAQIIVAIFRMSEIAARCVTALLPPHMKLDKSRTLSTTLRDDDDEENMKSILMEAGMGDEDAEDDEDAKRLGAFASLNPRTWVEIFLPDVGFVPVYPSGVGSDVHCGVRDGFFAVWNHVDDPSPIKLEFLDKTGPEHMNMVNPTHVHVATAITCTKKGFGRHQYAPSCIPLNQATAMSIASTLNSATGQNQWTSRFSWTVKELF